jgi:hypothetical protein
VISASEEEIALIAQDVRTRRALFDTPTSARLNEVCFGEAR